MHRFVYKSIALLLKKSIPVPILPLDKSEYASNNALSSKFILLAKKSDTSNCVSSLSLKVLHLDFIVAGIIVVKWFTIKIKLFWGGSSIILRIALCPYLFKSLTESIIAILAISPKDVLEKKFLNLRIWSTGIFFLSSTFSSIKRSGCKRVSLFDKIIEFFTYNYI